jgi:hypothetical protein
MQSDGNLVVYDSTNHPVWASNTAGHSGAFLSLSDSGQLSIESPPNVPLWQP